MDPRRSASRSERRFRRQRERLVDQLRERGISSERVLDAIRAVPRHLFVEPALRDRAYADKALPIGQEQTISQPFTVAYQTALLNPQPNDRILEVGTGSGYQAAVLCEMGARVFSVERHEALLRRTKRILSDLGYRVTTRLGDGSQGWPAFAPYAGIIVTAGADEVPRPLLDQLRAPNNHTGGRLIIPIGDDDGQQMHRFTRVGPKEYEREDYHSFRFVPLVRENNDGSE